MAAMNNSPQDEQMTQVLSQLNALGLPLHAAAGLFLVAVLMWAIHGQLEIDREQHAGALQVRPAAPVNTESHGLSWRANVAHNSPEHEVWAKYQNWIHRNNPPAGLCTVSRQWRWMKTPNRGKRSEPDRPPVKVETERLTLRCNLAKSVSKTKRTPSLPLGEHNLSFHFFGKSAPEDEPIATAEEPKGKSAEIPESPTSPAEGWMDWQGKKLRYNAQRGEWAL